MYTDEGQFSLGREDPNEQVLFLFVRSRHLGYGGQQHTDLLRS